MKKLGPLVLLVATAACANPTAPGGVTQPRTPAETWALAHANEVCMVVRLNSGERGQLFPATAYLAKVAEGFVLVPISYCNPAE